MKFSCPNCSAKYQIADEKVAGRTVKMKCRKCGTTIPISAPSKKSIAMAPLVVADSIAPSKPRPNAAPPDDGIEWHAGINGQAIGPMSRRELNRRVREGSVNKETFVWHQGMDGWKQIPDVAELDGLLEPQSLPIAPPPPSMPARAKAQALAPVPRMSAPAHRPAPRPHPAPTPRPGSIRPAASNTGALKPSRPTPAVGIAAAALRAPTPAEARPAHQASGWDEVLGDVDSAREGNAALAAAVAPAPRAALAAAPALQEAPAPPTEAPVPDVVTNGGAPFVSNTKTSEDSIMMQLRTKRANPWVVPFAVVAALVLGVTVGFVLFGDQETKIIRQVVEVPAKVKEAMEERQAVAENSEAGEGDAAAQEGSSAVPGASSGSRKSPTGKSTAPGSQPEVKGLQGLAGLDGLKGPSGGPAGPSDVGGGQELTSSQIQSTVAKYQTSVKRGCWEKALLTRDKDAPSSARVNVSISVSPSGNVQNATTTGDPRGYSGLASCIASRVRGWTFPRSSGSTTVNVPFVFAAQ